jgi:hypothetical protein
MFAFNIALLLLAAPVVSQPEAAEPRQLWWHHVENAWNSVVENVGHVWDSFGLDRTFPKLTEALESFVNEGWNFITDLKNGVTSVVDKFRNLGESIVEGYNPNGDWIANVATIVANVNQAVDCSTDTFELVVGVKCDADIQALEAELLSVWNAKSTINNRIQSIDVVDVQDPCPGSGVHLMEIEFDVRVRGDGIDSGAMNAFIESDLKPELVKESNWDIRQRHLSHSFFLRWTTTTNSLLIFNQIFVKLGMQVPPSLLMQPQASQNSKTKSIRSRMSLTRLEIK